MAANNSSNKNSRKRSIHDVEGTSKLTPKKKRKLDEYFQEEKSEVSDAKKSNKIKVREEFRRDIVRQREETASSPLEYAFNETRIRSKQEGAHGIPPKDLPVSGVIYWMSRDQRVQDNWAMVYAQKMAMQHKVPLIVVFCLQPTFLDATIRHFDFMIRGLQSVEEELNELDIPFKLLLGAPKDVIPAFAKKQRVNLVVADFSPLRIAKQWLLELGTNLEADKIHLAQVDAHNVIPLWVTSNKQEYAARTIRSKVHKHLNKYLVEFPPIVPHTFNADLMDLDTSIDWKQARSTLKVDMDVGVVKWCQPGPNTGLDELCDFIHSRLKQYHKDRNNPNKNAVSNLSPWYHFGQLSTARSAMEVNKYSAKYRESVDGYIEELIVRRELSDNFCFYNQNYDKISGAPQWAQDSLEVHEHDEREYVYTRNELECYQTHDDLWNAAQKQLVRDGKMHGFLRMYWAKKILEWTETPKEALSNAIYLNDKYSLDGRDPNGYVGCLWSVAGVHDQGWRERPVFGKVRYMNYQGCKRKFDVAAFVARMGIAAIKSGKK